MSNQPSPSVLAPAPPKVRYTYAASFRRGPFVLCEDAVSSLLANLAKHEQGEKDGSLFIGATFRGEDRRANANVISMTALMLDFDKGTPRQFLRDAIVRAGVPTALATTYSHMSTALEVPAAKWMAWIEKNPDGTPEQYMLAKGYKAAVAAGAVIVSEDNAPQVIIRHNPCPKHRAIIPFAKPWVIPPEMSTQQAAEAYKTIYSGMVRYLGLEGECDLSISDLCDFVYLPRHPAERAAHAYGEVLNVQ